MKISDEIIFRKQLITMPFGLMSRPKGQYLIYVNQISPIKWYFLVMVQQKFVCILIYLKHRQGLLEFNIRLSFGDNYLFIQKW